MAPTTITNTVTTVTVTETVTTTTTPTYLLVFEVVALHPTPFYARLFEEPSNTWNALIETFEELTEGLWEKVNVWQVSTKVEGVFELETPVHILDENANSTAILLNLYDNFAETFNAKVEATFAISSVQNIVWYSSEGQYEMAVVTTTTVDNSTNANSAPKAYQHGAVLACLAAVSVAIFGSWVN